MGITRTVTTRVHCDVCGEWVTGWESEGIGISREWAKYFVRLQGCTAGKRIICKECRIKQRIKKCSLQKKCGVAGMDGGACLGFSYDGDDEPIERCKRSPMLASVAFRAFLPCKFAAPVPALRTASPAAMPVNA